MPKHSSPSKNWGASSLLDWIQQAIMSREQWRFVHKYNVVQMLIVFLVIPLEEVSSMWFWKDFLDSQWWHGCSWPAIRSSISPKFEWLVRFSTSQYYLLFYIWSKHFMLIAGSPATAVVDSRVTLIGLSTAITECSAPSIYLRISPLLSWIFANSDASKYQCTAQPLTASGYTCFRFLS